MGGTSFLYRQEAGIRREARGLERTYRIIYRVDDDTIFVLTVFDGRRLLRFDELEP
jgi:mRNA-degrading endonuclease RelE of RelBE toxin-antitoxin system